MYNWGDISTESNESYDLEVKNYSLEFSMPSFYQLEDYGIYFMVLQMKNK